MGNGNKGKMKTHIKVFLKKCTIVGGYLRRGRRIRAAFSFSMWHS